MPRLVPIDSGHSCPSDLETRALAAVMGRSRLADFFMTALRRANQLFGAALTALDRPSGQSTLDFRVSRITNTLSACR